jgi:hypothetical protein
MSEWLPRRCVNLAEVLDEHHVTTGLVHVRIANPPAIR